jgi:hypothetical protein
MNLWKLFIRRLQRAMITPGPISSRPRSRRNTKGFRPTMLVLEDRTVPAADMFADATILTGAFATDSGSNTEATVEMGEPDPAADLPPAGGPVNSVWWQWTAPSDGMVEVNTVGSALDTVLAAYTGSAVDALTLLGANDDFYDMQSRVLFQATAGTTYHFSVDGFQADTGSIVLNLAMSPANDNFANAVPIGIGTYTGSNIGATAEANEPTSAGTSAPINSVWWAWTADRSETVEFNTFGSDFDTLLAVYTGPSVDSLQLVASNDDMNGLQSQVLFQAVEGTTYYIAIDGDGRQTGSIVLTHPSEPSGTNHPPVIGSGQTFMVDENAAGGTFVGTVLASDPDPNQRLTYSIIGGNTSDAFFIDSTTGAIAVQNGSALDFEANPTFDLIVKATDNGNPTLSTSETVTIQLLNRHDAPSFVDIGPFFVVENSADGALVGTVTATDVDFGQTITYAITGGNSFNAFGIDSQTGQITVVNSAALDFETTPVFALTVTATDNDTPALSSSTTVIVFVDDGNDVPRIADQTVFLDENSPTGTVAARANAVDPDAGQTLTYSIIGGNAAGAFAINSQTGWISVANGALLNYEMTRAFVLTVQVVDNGSPVLSSTAGITINLNDVNELAKFDSSGPFSVKENVASGTMVGRVAASDPDNGQQLTYAITGGNISSAFAIDTSTGEITVANAAALDFEARSTFTLTIRASDDGSPALAVATSVTITLIDVNDAPVLDNTGAMALMAINQGDVNNTGTLVSDILASAAIDRVTDQDLGAKEGIAIIAADTTHGVWQYSTNGGATWSNLGSISKESALLLSADALTRIRFVPATGFNGIVASGITFRAWDQTTGVNGGLADTSVNGGTAAFSKVAETASIKVRSPLEQVAILSTDVQSLVSSGVLSNSDASQLQSKLNNAKKQLEQGNSNPAVNQLNSFISIVTSLMNSGSLPRSFGDDLIAKANATIVSIQS